MRRNLVTTAASSLMILLFLYASTSKYWDFSSFQRAMHNQPLPYWFATILIWIIPVIEIAIAVMIFMPKTNMKGIYASFILMSLFTIYIIAGLLHIFTRVPCTCGGVIKNLTWSEHLLFNLFFVLLTLWAILENKVLNKKHSKTNHTSLS